MSQNYRVLSVLLWVNFNLFALNSSANIIPRKDLLALDFKHNYCTASDDKYFVLLLNLIGSIHRNDYKNLGEIAVFDLGLSAENLAQLARMEHVRILTPENKNPDLLKLFTARTDGTQVRGWFAWKPVIIQQYLREQDCFLYLDAGMTVMYNPEALFEYIRQKGYFLTSAEHNFIGRVTKTVNNYLQKQITSEQFAKIYTDQTIMLSAGVLGVTSKIRDSLIMPVYNLVLAQSLEFFADDGSTPAGFGTARHDQTLFSLYAQLNGLRITGSRKVIFVTMPQGPRKSFNIGGPIATIFKSRWDYNYAGGNTHCIRYKVNTK